MTHRPDQIRIRRARADDSRSLANLRYAFRAKGEKVIETKAAFLKRCERWIKKRISAKQSWQCWVAEDRRGLIGTIWVELIEKIPNPVSENERHGYITNFYVVPEARGRQAGEKLLRTALS